MFKRAFILFLMVIMLSSFVCGCGKYTYDSETGEEIETENSRIKLVYESSQWDRGIKVLEDCETGVQYLVFSKSYGMSITPLLNPDGTPYASGDY